MKNLKKVLALVLAVAMMMSVVVTASATYSDVADDYAYAEAIDVLSNIGVLDGFEDGTFKTEGTLTRAQAAKIVAIVHNAVVSGKGIQSNIKDLYSNAQNPFVDCNSSWALPYINYCRITGLADGMTATTYEPNRELTGVQFLKLMLTTLGFDTAKEGYTGTGWDVNVLRRANEVGLTDGLADGWKAIAAVTRGEAAQILLNALQSYLVEYGQVIKAGDKQFNLAFVSNESVNATGFTLFSKIGGTVVRTTDSFRRPGTKWSYGSWSNFYMDAPIAEYKTVVTECELLKVMGIPETSTKVLSLDGKGWNYYAVDGFKYYGDEAIELQHDTKKECQIVDGAADFSAHWFGGQGDLTQVFKTSDGYILTTIHTFLGTVTKLHTNSSRSHATAEYADVKYYVDTYQDEPVYAEATCYTTTISDMSYAAGTMVLGVQSQKKDEDVNVSDSYDEQEGNWSIVSVADSKTGKLTGASDLNHPETVSIDGTKYNANCRFVLGKDDAMYKGNNDTTFNFWFDSYGNVIGCTGVADSTTYDYVVMTKIWGEHVDGDFVIKANFVDLNGEAITGATVATAGDFAIAVENWDNVLDLVKAVYVDGYIGINTVAKYNTWLCSALYKYYVNASGAYVLTWVGEENTMEVEDPEFGYADYAILHEANRANLWVDGDEHINLSESTKFLVKDASGAYKAYVGYTALPALSASRIDYILDTNGYATIVYLEGALYAGDMITGYVPTWAPFNWVDGYDCITVYVKGEAMQVLVAKDAYLSNSGAGMYDLYTRVDANGLTYVEFEVSKALLYWGEGVVTMAADGSAITVATKGEDMPAIGLTGVAIYIVDGMTVTAGTAEDILVGDNVVVYKDATTGAVAEIYVYQN